MHIRVQHKERHMSQIWVPIRGRSEQPLGLSCLPAPPRSTNTLTTNTPLPVQTPPALDSTRAPFCPQYLQFKNTQAHGWLPGFTSYVIQENELFRPQARLPMSLNSLVVTRRWHIVVFHLAGVDLPAVPTPHRGEALNSGHCTIARQHFKGGPLQANH